MEGATEILTESEFRAIVLEEIKKLFEDETYSVYKVPGNPHDVLVDVVEDEDGDMDVIQFSNPETEEEIDGYSPEQEEKALRIIKSGNAERVEQQIEEKSEDDPCWEGYTQVGMKTDEDGNRVPNCVPTEDVPDATGYQEEQKIRENEEHKKLIRVLARLGVRGSRYDRATNSILVKSDMNDASISNVEKTVSGGWKAEVRHKGGYDIVRGSSLDDLGREIEKVLR